MEILRTPLEASRFLTKQKGYGKKVGLVPTMGALHHGHASLIEASNKENDLTVCSIYVNPAQFNNKQDFDTYPNIFDKDIALLEKIGCDIVFAPSHEEMYPYGTGNDLLKMGFGTIENEMEGKFRPGHFNGVGVVVCKLLNIIAPHKAYFGQKDLQQYLIIKKISIDLSYLTEIVMCPTIREADGLAMSSRNMRLTAQERKVAPLLYKTLNAAANDIKQGKTALEVKQIAFNAIAAEPMFTPEYVEIVDLRSFELLKGKMNGDLAICTSAHLGKARLIDNVIVRSN